MKVIKLGFNNHDCCEMYRCPHCHEVFDDWQLFHRKDKKHCPECGKEIDGVD